MHNIWVRLNAVIFFGLTVLLFAAIFCSLSTIFHNGKPIVKTLKLNKMKSMKSHSGQDRALFSFDIHADLRPAWHWNMKQLFVFVLAEYDSSVNSLNQVIIWDKIIKTPDQALLKKKKEFVKYSLIDQGKELRDKNVSLYLYWDAMPLTGRIYTENQLAGSMKLPSEYD